MSGVSGVSGGAGAGVFDGDVGRGGGVDVACGVRPWSCCFVVPVAFQQTYVQNHPVNKCYCSQGLLLLGTVHCRRRTYHCIHQNHRFRHGVLNSPRSGTFVLSCLNSGWVWALFFLKLSSLLCCRYILLLAGENYV